MAFCTLHFFSEALNREVSVNAFVPQNREGYKTLYLLHGLSDDQTVWQRYTEVELDAAQAGIAVIMPNGDRSFYTDLSSGDRYFTYISKELPEMMTRFFRGISPAREDNYIAGLSMGGYGALKAALTFPQRYAAACSLSGALDIPFMFDTYKVEGEAFYKSIFGSKEDFVGSTNDLFALLKKDAQNGVKLPEIFLSCGTSDRILPCSRRFYEACRMFGIPVSYTEAEGNHNWAFWRQQIKPFIRYIGSKT